MKKSLVLFLALLGLTNTPIMTQNVSTPSQKTYMTESPLFVGLGGSVPSGFLISGGAFSRHGWRGSLTYHYWAPNAEYLPSDFDGGHDIFWEGSDIVRQEVISSSDCRHQVDAEKSATFVH